MKELNIGLVGTGVIGKGVIELLHRNGKILEKRSGIKLNLIAACSLTVRSEKIEHLEGVALETDYRKIISNPRVQVVVELIGGDTTAYTLIQAAMRAGKHVVTANKAVLAKHGARLFDLACGSRVGLFFEAAIGGGIPIIKVIRESLAGNNIHSLYSIINGTTNYILSQITEQGKSYGEILAQAQALGFAEADPTLDVSGKDSAQKMALLSTVAFNTQVNWRDIYCEGIEEIKKEDIEAARRFGYCIKLLGIARDLGRGKIDLRVHPAWVPGHHRLASVHNEYNAVLVKSDFLGDSFYYGKGAGARPTASAVVSDLNDLTHLLARDVHFDPDRYRLFRSSRIQSIKEVSSKYSLRIQTREKTGILTRIATIFARCRVRLQSVVETDRGKESTASIFIVTHEVLEKNFLKAVSQINKLSLIRSPLIFYRICEFD